MERLCRGQAFAGTTTSFDQTCWLRHAHPCKPRALAPPLAQRRKEIAAAVMPVIRGLISARPRTGNAEQARPKVGHLCDASEVLELAKSEAFEELAQSAHHDLIMFFEQRSGRSCFLSTDT
jgi:hypothetical protein